MFFLTSISLYDRDTVGLTTFLWMSTRVMFHFDYNGCSAMKILVRSYMYMLSFLLDDYLGRKLLDYGVNVLQKLCELCIILQPHKNLCTLMIF